MYQEGITLWKLRKNEWAFFLKPEDLKLFKLQNFDVVSICLPFERFSIITMRFCFSIFSKLLISVSFRTCFHLMKLRLMSAYKRQTAKWELSPSFFIKKLCCWDFIAFCCRISSFTPADDNYAKQIKSFKEIINYFFHSSPKCVPVTLPTKARRISKSGSVPNLIETARATSPLLKASAGRRILKHQNMKHSSLVQRSSRDPSGLRPGMLKLHRHALSVDETCSLRQDSAHGSQVSVTFDPTPEIIDIEPVHKRRERNKRSDNSRRHVLSRQKPIEKEEPYSPKVAVDDRRRNSTKSENSFSSRRAERSSRTSSASRSFDSRCHNVSVSSTVEINDFLLRSPEKSPRKICSILSTPSTDKEFR